MKIYTIAGAKKKLQGEMRDSSRLKIVHSETTKKENFIKEVKVPSPVETPEIEDFEENLQIKEIEDFEENSEVSEIDDEQRDTLLSITSQLLELRAMLKKKPV
jgi:hypothetical protein